MSVKINKIVRSRRKSFALVVDKNGELIVRAPVYASDTQINHLVQEKSGWIIKKQKEVLARSSNKTNHKYENGEMFGFLGSQYPLKLVDRQKESLILEKSFLLKKNRQKDGESIFTNWYRDQARAYFADRVRELSTRFGFPQKNIRISGAKTRWGSCSSRGNLNFTWRLIMAPPEIIDYVIIHEIAHIKHPNHSRQFWQTVEKMMPNYKQHRIWLKKYGYLLSLN